jgi:hypothetical protein
MSPWDGAGEGGPKTPGGEREDLPVSGPAPEEGKDRVLEGGERRWDEENPGDDEPGEAP